MRVVWVIDDNEEMLCDDNSKLKRNARSRCLCFSGEMFCVIDDVGEEMLCDDNSKLKRNARFSCLCNRRWWRNVVWW